MFKKFIWVALLLMSLFLVGCNSDADTPEATAVDTTVDASAADLAAVKEYTINNAQEMKKGTTDLLATAVAYHTLLETYNFDYEAAWAADSDQLTSLVADAKANWLTASQYYELDEGIVAGVPSLAFYDVWIDAGPSAEEDPEEAHQWTLELPDGSSLESPGNFFHSLLEPTIWGTKPEFTGLLVDLDGSGDIVLGEALPDANVFLGAAQGLDAATSEMLTAVEEWEPTLSDAFTALVVMLPTMNEYFEQWKLSAFISGENAEEAAFIGTSRLFDITNILNGLDFTYKNVSVLVEEADADLHGQIEAGFVDLQGYVDDLYAQEQGGTVFSAEQTDLFGTEAQNKATVLAGQVAQSAGLLSITIEE